MLRVGEKSGDMAEMMERIAVFHDEELARWIECSPGSSSR
jgi:general secretion pathway protein F